MINHIRLITVKFPRIPGLNIVFCSLSCCNVTIMAAIYWELNVYFTMPCEKCFTSLVHLILISALRFRSLPLTLCFHDPFLCHADYWEP